jgi:hypothetical protein
LNQIEAKTKAKDKLPSWFNTKNNYLPSKISIEQTSSENSTIQIYYCFWCASPIDLAGGFGVDDYYFSKSVTTVDHCEINPELSEIVALIHS